MKHVQHLEENYRAVAYSHQLDDYGKFSEYQWKSSIFIVSSNKVLEVLHIIIEKYLKL